MIFNIKDPDIRAVEFGVHFDKFTVNSLIYLKSHNRL